MGSEMCIRDSFEGSLILSEAGYNTYDGAQNSKEARANGLS